MEARKNITNKKFKVKKDMKKFTQLFITVLTFITAGAWSVPAWGDYYTTVYVNAEPSNGGGVSATGVSTSAGTYQASDNNTQSTWLRTTVHEHQSWASANEGYTFKGWASSASANSGSSTSNPKIDLIYAGKSNTSSPGKTTTYYAIFAGIVNPTTNKPSASLSFGEKALNSSKELDLVFQHAHAGKISSSFGGTNSGDFKLKAGTSLPTNSVSQANCTIKVVFTPSCSGTRTATLTLTGDNGGSMAISLSGSGAETTPSFSTSNGSVNVTVGSPATTLNLNNLVSTNADGERTYTCNNSAVTIDGNTFSATKAGKYTVNVSIAHGCVYKACSGSFEVTVNRLNPTLNMDNGSVNVTTDKANPVELDLSTLKASGTTTGIGAFDSFVLQSADASTGAKADGVTIDGSKFSSTVGGKYTVRATTKQNNQYNSTYKDFTVTVNRLTQTISWSSDESVFVEEDVISATSIGDVTLEKSGTGAEYVTIEGNTATVCEVEANSSVTLTATAAQTDVYAQATGSKTITLTSLQKQHITFDQNLTKLKTTDGTKKVELVATSDSDRDSYITFAVDANTAGVSVTQEGGKWYLNYTGTAVKGIAVTASLAGVEGVSIAASDVSQMVKVTDPTAKCDINEGLATASGLANTTKTYDLTIPKQVVLKVRSSKSKIYTNTYEVKFYDKNNKEISTGSTQSWTGRTWDQTIDTRTFSNLNKDIVKMVFKSNASNGFDITEASYTRWSYTTPSKSELSFEAYALSTVEDQTFTLDYANYQIELSIEGSSNFVIKSEDSFGDCETYGSETIRVGYNVPAEAIEETAYLYIRDNTGAELGKITLNATVIGGLTQNITYTNIQSSYLTTDLVNLTATTDRGLTNFSYSASPAGIANFNGSQMTFSQSGTIAITVTEAGNGAYAEASTTVNGVQVNKVTPTIAENPSVATIKYKDSFANGLFSGGKATVTLRGVENTEVDGTFGWTNSGNVADGEGSHDYSVTFTPTNGNMYAPKVFTLPVTVSRAAGGIEMNDGSVKVKISNINDNLDECKIALNGLIQSKINDAGHEGAVSYVFKDTQTKNTTGAEIDDNNIFSATVVGTYTLVAKQAQTDYYTEATDEFDIVVEKVVPTFTGTDNYSMKVGAEQPNAFSFEDVETLVPHITHHINAINNGDGQVIEYDAANNKIIAHNAGTAEIYFTQEENGTNAGGTSAVFHYTVTKHEPKFTWNKNNKEYYYESTIANIFESSNTATDTTVVSNNPTAAYVENNTLHILNVEENTTFSIHQAENYYWAAKDTSITITPKVTDNHVTFTIDKDNKDYMVSVNDGENVVWDNNGYKMGDGTWVYSQAPETYIIISFTGTPDRLTFTKTLDKVAVFNQYPADDQCLFEVYESATNGNWGSPIWSYNQQEASRDVTDVPPLNPTTRYLKLRYHGTVYGHFNNIKVTELKRFDADKEIVDFGLQGAAYGVQEMQLNFTHANAGRTTNMEIVGSDAAYFSVEPNVLPETGRDITGTVNFHVFFDNGSDRRGTNPYNAELVFTDNLGHEEHVALTGVRDGLSLPTFTFNPNNLPYYYGSTIANVAVSTNTDYTNCPLSYQTTDRDIAFVDETGLHIGNKQGEVTITVHQDGGGDFREWSKGFTFTPRERPSLHTPFVVTSSVFNNAGKSGSNCSWNNDENRVELGYSGLGGFNWDSKSFTLVFDGMPDSLSFQYACSASGTTGVAVWQVKESADGSNWTQVWIDGAHSNAWQTMHASLKESTRYLQFIYSANFAGYLKDIKVTGIEGYAFLRAGDGQYLSRGADWSTRAIVDEYGVACRITRTTNDNTNYKTRLQFVDSEQYMFEDGDAIYTDHSGRTPIYWNIVENAGTVTIQSANNTSHNGHYVTVNEDGVLAFTSDAAQATHWYKDGAAQYQNYITQKLDQQATAAAQYDFEGLKTLAAVRKELNENEYDFNVIDVPAVAEYIEQKGDYRNSVGVIQNNYEYVAEDLIPGFYKLTVQGFNRMGSQKAAYTMFANNMESSLAYIYANDVKYPMMSLLNVSGRRSVASPTGTDYYYPDGYFYADDKEAALVSFANEKAYLNDVYVYVDADEGKETGTLRYGIRNTSYIDGAWLIYGNIKLYRLARAEYVFNPENNDKRWGESDNWNREDGKTPTDQSVVVVKKDAEITGNAAVYSLTIDEDVTVTVKSGATLTIGDSNPYPRTTYGNLHVEDGGKVVLKDGELRVNDVILDAALGMTDEQTTSASCSGQITNESQLVVNGDAYFRLALDPSGRNTLGWYDFVVPFPVDVIGGISIAEDPSAVMQFNVNYAVMAYDEAKNAQRGKHWNKFTGTMLPGKAYTITLDETKPWNTVVFKKKAGEAVTGDRSFTTEYSGLGATQNNGWNGFGNGTLHHTELDVAPGTLIQLYDHAHRCYQPREAKDYTIAVGLSFFMQFDRVETVNLLAAEGNGANFRAPERAISNVEKFRLALTAEDAINPADYIWISASEEATDEYVIGRDVLKMGSMNESTVARMWTTRAGMGLCSNEMPLVDNIAQCALGLYAPQARTYTIAVEEAPQDANLYLTYNDQVIWDLTLGAYTIDLAKGKTTGYGLRIEARAPQIATGVENAAVDSKSARKVMINNTLYVVTPEGEMYDITGKFVK